MSDFDPDMRLGDAADRVLDLRPEGVTCPCCTQFAKEYRWSLYSTAARALMLFYVEGGTAKWVHSTRLKELGHQGQGDAARLRMWGLVEQERERRPDGGRSGFWRVTDFGGRFVRGEVTIPKYAYTFDSAVLRLDGPPVTIREALGDKFDYGVMMASAPPPPTPAVPTPALF